MIWQYRGGTARRVDDYADQMKSPSLRDRTIAVRAVRFSEELAAAASAGQTLYDDGYFTVFLWHGR